MSLSIWFSISSVSELAKYVCETIGGMSERIDSAALRLMAWRSSGVGGGGAGGPRLLLGKRAMRRLSRIGGMIFGERRFVWIVLWRNLLVALVSLLCLLVNVVTRCGIWEIDCWKEARVKQVHACII